MAEETEIRTKAEVAKTLNTSQGTAWEKFMFWKLALTKVSGKALNALLLSVVGTLNGTEWSSFTQTQKFVAVVVAVGAAWLVIDAFLSDTMTKLTEQAEVERKSQIVIEANKP